jgi:hypothetical protein
MMDALDILRSRLDATFNRAFHSWESLGKSQAMSRTLEEVRRTHDSPAEHINERTVAMAVDAFMETGQLSGFRDLKYVCLGAGSIGTNGQCLLAQKRFRDNLLTLAESDEPRRQLKCFQSLLRSYWSFPLNGTDLPEVAREGWIVLRSWLASRQKALDKIAIHKPDWFVTLSWHSNLLTDKPCDRYGPALLHGDGTELDQAIKELAIPTESWVMEEVVFAQMKSAYALRDEDFKSALPKLLAVAQGKAGVDVSKTLATRCIAQLVIRYARCSSKPEDKELRDAAISAIGNPWLQRSSWDAHVIDDKGKPSDESREMVNAWLKRRLIRDFFDLLSADSAGDTRRLDYWLRFEPMIEDMWFALGANARKRCSQSFNDFKYRARGRLLNLDGTTSDNNAFIMRIGAYLAVEFGAKGNAFFLFRWDSLPPGLSKALAAVKEQPYVSIYNLKSSKNEDRLIHIDRPYAGLSWEQQFDDFICPLIGSRPHEKPHQYGKTRSIRGSQQTKTKVDQDQLFSWLDFQKLVTKHSLHMIDRRKTGGNLRVIDNDLDSAIADKLKAWGFSHKTGKGWWKE